jgi:hypothetical protein
MICAISSAPVCDVGKERFTVHPVCLVLRMRAVSHRQFMCARLNPMLGGALARCPTALLVRIE